MNLSPADAAELGQILQFLDDWLATDHEQLSTSLARFIGIDGYGVETLRDDLARFMFLLGETDGEGLFSPRTAELAEPAAIPVLTAANTVSSARGTFSPAELTEIVPVRNVSLAANECEWAQGCRGPGGVAEQHTAAVSASSMASARAASADRRSRH